MKKADYVYREVRGLDDEAVVRVADAGSTVWVWRTWQVPGYTLVGEQWLTKDQRSDGQEGWATQWRLA